MDWEEAGKLTRALYQQNKGDLINTVRQLLFAAYERGSTDNISVLLTRVSREPTPANSFHRSFVADYEGKSRRRRTIDGLLAFLSEK